MWIDGLIVDKIPEEDQDCDIYCLTGQHQSIFNDAFDASAFVRIRDVGVSWIASRAISPTSAKRSPSNVSAAGRDLVR